MNRAEFTFNAVDDLAEAYLRGKVPPPGPGQAFCPNRLGPLIELALQSSSGHAWLHSRCWPTWHAGRKAEAVAALAKLGITTSRTSL